MSRRRFLGIAALAVAVSVGVGSPSAQQASERIAAVVNNDAISTQDLKERVELALATSGLPDDPDTRRRIAPQVLRGFIDETLQLQEARRLRLDVTEAEIDRAFATIAQRNNLSPQALADYLTKRGVDPQVVRRQLRAQIAWIKVVGRELRPKVVVTREQVDLAMRAGGAGEDEVLLAEIVLPVYQADQEPNVMRDAQELARAVRNGGNFAALARQLSSSGSAEAGGDLGWVKISALAPELKPVVEGLRPGAVSDPVRTAAGVHLIQLRERRSARADPGEAARAEMQRRLEEEQLQRLASRYLRDLRRQAFIDIRI